MLEHLPDLQELQSFSRQAMPIIHRKDSSQKAQQIEALSNSKAGN